MTKAIILFMFFTYQNSGVRVTNNISQKMLEETRINKRDEEMLRLTYIL